MNCPDGSDRFDEYRLIFGRNIGDAEGVSDYDWRAFLPDTVTPRFPDGLSAFDAAGQRRNFQGERTRAFQEGADSPRARHGPPDTAERNCGGVQGAIQPRVRVTDSACVAF
ncbi:MAG: DUF3574 domain-containing protein [Chloroflexi bacterium]|nr:DUF3574 domain-containing protein [Chloroflexota bacterium]